MDESSLQRTAGSLSEKVVLCKDFPLSLIVTLKCFINSYLCNSVQAWCGTLARVRGQLGEADSLLPQGSQPQQGLPCLEEPPRSSHPRGPISSQTFWLCSPQPPKLAAFLTMSQRKQQPPGEAPGCSSSWDCSATVSVQTMHLLVRM